MKTAGVVCEFNPYHNGHRYLIEKLREKGATHIVGVMSGNFVQRGEAALFSKFIRARAALLSGADMIVELPVPYAIASAERFALGAVSILKEIGVDMIGFGCETDDSELIRNSARAASSGEVKDLIPKYLSEGMSYPAAKNLAVKEVFGGEYSGFLSSPNNLLASEYVNAMDRLSFETEICPVKRVGEAHDSMEKSSLPSGSYLRDMIEKGLLQDALEGVPKSCFEIYKSAIEKGEFTDRSKEDTAEFSYLRRLNSENFLNFADVSEGLNYRIADAVAACGSLSETIKSVKTKRYVLTRVRRILLSAYLGIDKSFYDTLPPYIRVLGVTEKGRELLNTMGGNAEIPVGTSLIKLGSRNETCKKFAEAEIFAGNLYSAVQFSGKAAGEDLYSGIIKI